MTGLSVRIEIDDADVMAALARIEEATGDLFPVMDAIGAGLVASSQFRFETGVGPDGKPWPASARVRDHGGQTLRLQSHLMSSVTHQASDDQVEVGSPLIYARIHQEGGDIRAKNAKALAFGAPGNLAFRSSVTIPKRAYLPDGELNADDSDMALDEVNAFLTAVLDEGYS